MWQSTRILLTVAGIALIGFTTVRAEEPKEQPKEEPKGVTITIGGNHQGVITVRGATTAPSDPNAPGGAAAGAAGAGADIEKAGTMILRGVTDAGPLMLWPMGADEEPTSVLVDFLGQLNLSPDFTLTAEEKTKIAAARKAHKEAMEAWQKAHAQEIEKIQNQSANAAAASDNAKVEAAMKAEMDLRATAPSTDDMDKQIRAALTEDHRKAVDAKLAVDNDGDGKQNEGVIRFQISPMPQKQ
jgi:hypothetical protein